MRKTLNKQDRPIVILIFNYFILIDGFLSAVSVDVMRLLKEDYAPLFGSAQYTILKIKL